MRKILGIGILSLSFYLNPLNINNSNADHYNKGFFFADPYVIGCIYDLLDASFGTKCAHRSIKFYYHEGKHKGSWDKAYQDCRNYLRSTAYRKYRDFNNDDYSIECSG